MKPTNEILVVVHPGSACGSADFNIGAMEAKLGRENITYELNSWPGSVVVIDGAFSDELGAYPEFDKAIKNALIKAKEDGFMGQRLYGCDQDGAEQEKRIQEVIQGMTEEMRTQAVFTVTGAWYDSEDGGGCVGGVVEKIRSLGCISHVSESAIRYDVDDATLAADEVDEGIDSDEPLPAPPKPFRP